MTRDGMKTVRGGGRLMDCATIAREYGVSRRVASAWMRQIPKVRTPGVDKVWIKRADLEAYIDTHTRAA